MRRLINRRRDRISARLHQDDLHALNARVSWLAERSMTWKSNDGARERRPTW